MSELLTRTPRPVRTRARASDSQAPLAGQVLPPISLSPDAAHRPPGRRPATPRNGLAAAWASAWHELLSSRAGQSEQLLRIGPHLTLLTIVLLAVAFGGIGQPAASPERASDLPLDQPLLTAADSPANSLAIPEVQVRVIQPTDEPRIHIVQPGENVSVIAARYGMDQWPVLWTNELEQDQTIRPGDTLRIPPVPGAGRTVKAGDTLESIAKKFDVDPAVIVEFPGNKLQPGADLVVGTYLFVPGGRLPIPELTPGLATGRLRWPARGRITDRYRPGHPGIDIAANHGVPIYAADGGVVRSAFWNGNYGNQVVINHGNGIVTSYSHLSSFAVGAGQLVAKGSIIGYNGSTGYSTGPHLHFEVIRNGYYVDPLKDNLLR